jgi:flagellin-like hook-associated protein FlgL
MYLVYEKCLQQLKLILRNPTGIKWHRNSFMSQKQRMLQKIFIVDTKYILHGVLPNQDGDISENGLYPGDIWIQQSANSAWDGLAISTVDATTGGIGIDGISVGTLKDANAAITTINDGVNKVSEYRAMFGATQNRLEHMLNSNRVTSENVTAAESRIRDTDMAKEVAEMTKENILQQAGQSILQQSINQPNQVLQMLQ